MGTMNRYGAALILATPAAILGTVDYIVAVNFQWGWRTTADAAPTSIPVYIALWTVVSLVAIGAGTRKGSALVALIAWIVAAACLPLATLFQVLMNDYPDPILPQWAIVIITAFLGLGFTMAGLSVHMKVRWEIDLARERFRRSRRY